MVRFRVRVRVGVRVRVWLRVWLRLRLRFLKVMTQRYRSFRLVFCGLVLILLSLDL